MVFCLAAVGGDLTGLAAHALWRTFSREGRLWQCLKRLEQTGLVSVHGEGRIDQRVLRLTDAGRREAQGGIDPPALWARRWDRRWRIVAFDIPESATALRTRLRRRLHDYRFGWLQNSVWLSPDPIDEFRAALNEKNPFPDSLTFLEAAPAGGESNDALVAATWDFHALGKSHAAYLDILRLRPGRSRPLEAWTKWLQTEQRAWRRIARADPFLPEELLPNGYLGQQVWTARQQAMADFATAVSRSAAR